MISSYDQPSKTEQIVRSRTRRWRAARPMTICVPGGIWVYAFIIYSLCSYETFAIHEFRIQHSGSRRSTDRVVAEHPEFIIENVAHANRTDDHCHALAAITVQPGLRPLNVRLQMDDRPGGGRQVQLIDRRREVPNRRLNFFSRCFAAKLDRNSFEMAITHIHSVCHGADAHRRIHEPTIAPLA